MPEEERVEASSENKHRGGDVTCWGRLFQVRAAATGKARSPTVDSRTFSDSEEVEGRRNWPCTGAHRRGTIVSK